MYSDMIVGVFGVYILQMTRLFEDLFVYLRV